MPRFLTSLAAPAMLAALLASVPAGAAPPKASGIEEIGRWNDGPAGCLALEGTVAWYGRGSRLEAADLTDPAHPRPLASLELPGGPSDLAVRDGWVYAMIGGELVVVDARLPVRPRIAARLALPAAGWGGGRLDLSGDVAYCMVGDLFVVDITDPARPALGRRVGGLWGRDVAAADGRLYVAGHYGLCVLDATDPRAPVLLEVDEGGLSYSEGTFVQVVDGYVILGVRGNGYTCRETRGDHVAPGWWFIHGLCPMAVARHGTNLYAAGGSIGRYVPYDGSAHWFDEDLVDRCVDVEIAGDLMVVTSTSAGLVTYDLAVGPEPVRLATVAAAPPLGELAVAGDRAYAASGFSGLQMLDVSQPQCPRRLGAYADGFDVPARDRFLASFVRPRENLVLLGSVTGLRIVDATDGLAPRLVRDVRLTPGGHPLNALQALVVDGGWLVMCADYVDDSYTPRSLYLLVQPTADGDVAVSEVTWPADIPHGRYAGDGHLSYVVDGAQGLVIFRVTADGGFARLGSVPLGDVACRSLTVADGFAYLATWDEVLVVDVRDPGQPYLRGRTGPLPWYSNDGITRLAAYSRQVFAHFGWGLGLVDATDPDAPFGHEGWQANGYFGVLAAGDGEVYVDVPGGGLTALRALHTQRIAGVPGAAGDGAFAVAAAPNPCNPRTTITFDLPQAGRATVTVFDARGRRVRRLHHGQLGAGLQALPWTGDDDDGRAVAAGVYLVRVATASGTQVARVAVVR
ncbi:MAG: T9SS type A sorting domain-containing protein [bacterium]|nr:T9SS type A sorting domain-containing protein [bacterium]